jgi:RNA polymerase sigma-70 factor (ECF subfamily)
VNVDRSSDATRLQALREGDAAVFDELVAHWQRPLFAFAWRYVHHHADAEDLVIEAFVRLHEQRRRLRPDTNLSAWLFTTLANLCHNHHRWRRRHPEHSFEAAEDAPAAPGLALASPAPLPSAALEGDETDRAVRAAINHLPHDQKTVVLLHHFEHLGYREIAAIVGCSERGVETRLYRARQRLRDALRPLLPEFAPR